MEGNAFLNGANFRDGIVAGLKAGTIRDIAGGFINGVSSGYRASKYGGDFFLR